MHGMAKAMMMKSAKVVALMAGFLVRRGLPKDPAASDHNVAMSVGICL
jgi:hypothetical protein